MYPLRANTFLLYYTSNAFKLCSKLVILLKKKKKKNLMALIHMVLLYLITFIIQKYSELLKLVSGLLRKKCCILFYQISSAMCIDLV